MVDWEGGRRGGVEDRRGLGGGALIGGGGIGAVVIALVGYFVFGIDPQVLLSQTSQVSGAASGPVAAGACPEGDKACDFADVMHTSANDVWASAIQGYEPSTIVLYTQGTQTGCGMGQSAMGPFYCPADRRVYLDLDFARTLEQQLGASGDFALAYVIGHEVGHHVQNLTGVSGEVHQAQQRLSESGSNALSVKLELQADCYAGVWARRSDTQYHWLQTGDLEEAINAASAVGDDTLQKRGGGSVVPDSFTHGTSKERMFWFNTGYAAGDPNACDTFSKA
ncbi:neutral zinc metallopeptidase [Asticcacaulis sp. AND118]|uniref:KPN_02809 family neutral zinc metallopeptidase n=1 Tax=Asticcacaulis sp. AND118 TaxID=2840468 RepID=UPI001CFF649D|nr:neutral zinc metallopeptidase [Asticcacaulis sp. AND118]UDF04480.1 neutral zinc metallopeptidase [Asticcacaulis sp. AND118]